MSKKKILAFAAVLFIMILPLLLSSYGIRLAGEFFIMAIFALSLGLVMGYGGLMSFGHAAFFGSGVYSVAILSQYVTNTYLLILSALIIPAFLAFISGLLFVRMPGSYFFMLTMAFNQLLYAFFYKVKSVAGGADGMVIGAVPNFGFGSLTSPIALYYLISFVFIVVFLLVYILIHSPTGKIVIGAKENEERMKALGYNTARYKVLAYTISGAIGGLAGSLYAFFNMFASPEIISFGLSGQAMIMVIIGGIGTLTGPPIGALIFVVLQSYISSFTDYWPMFMGLLFVIIVLVGRGGVAHWIADAGRALTSLQLFRSRKKKQETSNELSSNRS